MANVPILKFNAGVASPLIDARADVEKYNSLCRTLQNLIPRIYGGVERRPGTYYYQTAYSDTDGTVRLIPFIYNSTIAYVLEFGDEYIRALYGGSVIETISSPYAVADIFEIQYRQYGDTMWLVHSSYAPRKFTRTSATTFDISAIEFSPPPFLTRNDLIDPDGSGATMTCSVTDVDDSGNLTCTAPVFDDDHVGAYFKLVHPRETTSVSQSGEGTSDALDIKGTFFFNTHGTWTGTVILQRRENSSSSNDWEDYRTYKANGDRTIQFSGTEEFENVEYRIKAEAGMSSAFKGEITSNEATQTGIVYVDSVTDSVTAGVTVIDELASTNATKRWAESAWSDYRGWPSCIAFKDDRCIYGGQAAIADQITSDSGTQISYEADGTDFDDMTGGGGVVSQHKLAQSFTPSADTLVSSVSLYMYRENDPGNLIVSIQGVDGDELPDGTDIDSVTGTLDVATEVTDVEGNATWYEITLSSSVLVESGTQYAVVFYCDDLQETGPTKTVHTKYQSPGTFTGGIRLRKTSNVAGWVKQIGPPETDFLFKLTGTV